MVDTYNRRKELASRYGRDDRTHSRGHRRTAALNHPREREREGERAVSSGRLRKERRYVSGFSLRRAGYGAGASEKMVEEKKGRVSFPLRTNGRCLPESGSKTRRRTF